MTFNTNRGEVTWEPVNRFAHWALENILPYSNGAIQDRILFSIVQLGWVRQKGRKKGLKLIVWCEERA